MNRVDNYKEEAGLDLPLHDLFVDIFTNDIV